MTPAEQQDVVLLRRRFGVSASEYLYEMPWWEVELLLPDELEEPEPVGPRASPFARVPAGLADL